jgi:hypothetical protein
MTIHRHVVHHHPRITKVPFKCWPTAWGGQWQVSCDCGAWTCRKDWHDALAAALHHADTP